MLEERIRNPLPIPEQCDNCASLDIAFTGNERIYGKPYGEWPFAYYCNACGAAVGCHPGTRIPLGRMADKKTRQLRAKLHSVFDPLWESGGMTRTEAYQWLSRQLGIDYAQCHISQLDREQMRKAVDACKAFVTENNLETLKRRKEKKDAKRIKRIQRERRQNERFTKFTKRNSSVGRARRREQDSGSDS